MYIKYYLLLLLVSVNCLSAQDNPISMWDKKTVFPYKVKTLTKEKMDEIAQLPLSEFEKWVKEQFVLTYYSSLEMKPEGRHDFPYCPMHIVDTLLYRVEKEYVVSRAVLDSIFLQQCQFYSMFVEQLYSFESLKSKGISPKEDLSRYMEEQLKIFYVNIDENLKNYGVLTLKKMDSSSYMFLREFQEKIGNVPSVSSRPLRDIFNEKLYRLRQQLGEYYNYATHLGYGSEGVSPEAIEKNFAMMSNYQPAINKALYLECYSTNFLGYRESRVKENYVDNSFQFIHAIKNDSLNPFQYSKGGLAFTNWQQRVVFDEFLHRSLLIEKKEFPYVPEDENNKHYPYQDYLRRFFRKTTETKVAE